MVFNPSPGEKIEAGDHLVVLGDASQLKEVEHRVSGQGEAG